MDGEACGDSVRVALASLLRVIDNLGGEVLMGERRGVEAFEAHVRSICFAHLDGVSAAETAAGVALAHALVEPILLRLRHRAQGEAEAPQVRLH